MTGPGGAETVVLNLAAGMSRYGWRSLVAIPAMGWLGGALKAAGIEPVIIPDGRRLHYLRGLVNTIRRERADIVHAHLLGPTSYASVAGILAGVPVVCTFHGHSDVTPPSLFERGRFAMIARGMKRVVLVSEPLQQALLKTGRIRDAQTSVIPNGVDTSEFMPRMDRSFRRAAGIDGDAFVVGAVGNLRRPKDYPTFLRAAALLAEMCPQYRFVIVGEGENEIHRELVQLREQLGLEDRLIFTGFRSDVQFILNSFDALLVSSSSEGFSLAAIQAMASGVPVLATRCGGPEQIIDDGVDGILVPVGDVTAIAAGIETLRTDPSMRERIRDRALTKARCDYSLGKTLESYSALYEQVLSPSGT